MRHWLMAQSQRLRAHFAGPRRRAALAAWLAPGLLVLIWWQAGLWYRAQLLADRRAQVAAELIILGLLVGLVYLMVNRQARLALTVQQRTQEIAKVNWLLLNQSPAL